MNQRDDMHWIEVCGDTDVVPESGACVLINGVQVAVFNGPLGRWFAIENRCPHWGEQVLSRGLVGEQGGAPKVACPIHKRTFSLETGACLSGDAPAIRAFAVRVENGRVLVGVPSELGASKAA